MRNARTNATRGALALALALMGLSLPPAHAWITNDNPPNQPNFLTSHLLPYDAVLFGREIYGPNFVAFPLMGQPTPALPLNATAPNLDHSGVGRIVATIPVGNSTTDVPFTASLLDTPQRDVLITAAHAFFANLDEQVTINRAQAISVIFESPEGKQFTYTLSGTAATRRVCFPPQFDGKWTHGHDVAFVFLNNSVDPSIASYRMASGTLGLPQGVLQRPHVKVGYGVPGYGGARQSDGSTQVGTCPTQGCPKRWGMNVWDEMGLGADNTAFCVPSGAGTCVGYGVVNSTTGYDLRTQRSDRQYVYDFDNINYSPTYDAFSYFFNNNPAPQFAHANYLPASINGYGRDEVQQAPGDSGAPSFVNPAVDAISHSNWSPGSSGQGGSSEPWVIAGVTSHLLVGSHGPTQMPSEWIDFLPFPPGPLDHSRPFGNRGWRTFGVDTRVDDATYGALIAVWRQRLAQGLTCN